MRWCPVCGEEMSPEFGSPCEDPIAWSCPACGSLQLETGGRSLTEEQASIVREIARRPSAAAVAAERGVTAPVRTAREIVAAFAFAVPVDVERAARLLGCPVDWVSRAGHERGGIVRQGDRQILVLNREYPFASEAERRWVVAEELGHAVLGHSALAASREPGGAPSLVEPERRRQEHDARAFAAELLMPASEVRAQFRRADPRVRWAPGHGERQEAARQIVADLARRFQVSQAAMRIRLEELGLLR